MSLAACIATPVVMSPMAVMAERCPARGAAHLPVNSAPDVAARSWAPQQVARRLVPGLGAVVFVPLGFLSPGTVGAAIVGLSSLGGQALHRWLIGRTA